MKHSPKVIVVMPAHNAAQTLEDSYHRLPLNYINEVILVDDASTDDTYKIAKSLPIRVYRNELNLGYGGNLKVCLTHALERKADIIIEYHPDNQYDPKNLPFFIEKAEQGYDFALGSRFVHPREALDRNMPILKFIANRALTFVDKFILGIELSEFHSGFRMYTRKLLKNVPYRQDSDNYLFSFEIIVQAVYYGFKISEVQISCDYHPKMHTANLYHSSIYAIGTFKTLWQYVLAKFAKKTNGPFKKVSIVNCHLCKGTITRLEHIVQDAVSNELFMIYFCSQCQIGYTTPTPQNFSSYYSDTYYSKIKSFIYRMIQIRRPQIVRSLIKKGFIIDIGCGDGQIRTQLDQKKYDYTGIETPFASIKNKYVKAVGVEGMKEPNSKYDLATFWESFEHLKNPVETLEKTYRLLKKNGYIVIECPNYSSWEKNIFESQWFHLDPPRHVYHYTPRGLKQQLEKIGFKTKMTALVYAPEYTPVGLAQSILYRISPNLNVFAHSYKKKRNFILPFFLALLSLCMVPFSYFVYILRGSPIQLIIAKKK